FIAKLDEAGRFVWGVPGGFRLQEDNGLFGIDLRGFQVAIDADGNLVSAEGFIYFWDSGMLTGGGVSINKYAPDGAHLWSVPIHPPVTGNFDHPGYVLG